MKKSVLALTIGALAAGAVLAEDKGPTVYGKINVSLERETVDPAPGLPENEDKWVLESNASRLGVKGEMDLDAEGLSAIYQAEFEIFPDDGLKEGKESCKNVVLTDSGGDTVTVKECTDSDDQTFTQRNIFAGLKGSFGEVKAGMFDTPMKLSQGKVDHFSDWDGDLKNIMAGEIRAKNIIQYTSPTLADAVTVNVALIPNEDNDDFDANGENENGVADTISASVVFESDNLYASLAMDQDMVDGLEADDTGASETIDILRATAIYKMDALEVGALYQTAEETEGDGEESSILVSGAFKVDKMKFKLQHGMTEGDVSKDEITQTSAGVDYSLSKKAMLFAYYTQWEYDYDAAATASDEFDSFALGAEVKF